MQTIGIGVRTVSARLAQSAATIKHTRSIYISNLNTFHSHSRGFHSSRCTLAKHDPYKVLGVSKTATAAEIKAAYYKLAKLHHPDSSSKPNTTEFQKAQDAYEILSDPKKKSEYEAENSYSQSSGFSGWGYDGGAHESNIWEDLGSYEEDHYAFFGGGFNGGFGRRAKAERNPVRKGADLHADLKLSFMESIDGCVKPITYHCDEACSNCDNTGKSKAEKKKQCRACNGRGFRTMMGAFGRPRKVQCPTCVGVGKVESLCSACGGAGVKSTERQVEVKIPAGVGADTNLKLSGMGDAGRRGGKAGDLRLNIQILPDQTERFTRQGDDIHAKLDVDIGTAILGGKVSVETIRGIEVVRLQAPIIHGQTVRIRGGGVQKTNSHPPKFGDHILSVSLKMPSKEQLTPAQQELLQQISQLTVKPSQSTSNQSKQSTSKQSKQSTSKQSKQSDENNKTSTQKLNTSRRTASSKKKQAASRHEEPDDDEEGFVYVSEEDLYDFDFGDFEPSPKKRNRSPKKRARF